MTTMMSVPPNGRQPSTGSSVDALPAVAQLSLPKQWRTYERMVQRERREETDELWRRLDDLVTDASAFSLPRELCALSTPAPCASPCSGDCAQSSLTQLTALMGVVFWRRADGAANERGPSST